MSDRGLDFIVNPIHEAFFGEHYVGQTRLYNAIRDGVLQAYELGKQHATNPQDVLVLDATTGKEASTDGQ